MPDAEILLLGTTDGYANIHAPNERVLLEEFEKAVVVEAEFLGRYADVVPAGTGRGMSEPAAAPPTPAEPPRGLMVRVLDAIERGGNKMPHPAILFLWLCVGVIVLSLLLAWADVKVTYEVAKPPPIAVEENVLRRLDAAVGRAPGRVDPGGRVRDRHARPPRSRACSRPTGSASCSPRSSRTSATSRRSAIILVVMIGVGLAEASGLIGALIRKLVAVSSEATLTPHHRLHRDPLERRLRRRATSC